MFRASKKHKTVALLAEGVDRNSTCPSRPAVARWVALLAEGVDRNMHCAMMGAAYTAVALLAEGVDRNADVQAAGRDLNGRPPRGGRG